jgi:hypothetical protein
LRQALFFFAKLEIKNDWNGSLCSSLLQWELNIQNSHRSFFCSHWTNSIKFVILSFS